MSAPLLLVAEPTVYTDQPDEIPELLTDITETGPDSIIVVLPRGLAAPNRIAYLSSIADRIRDIGYVVEHREMMIEGRKRRVIVAQDDRRGRSPVFRNDFGQLVLANQ